MPPGDLLMGRLNRWVFEPSLLMYPCPLSSVESEHEPRFGRLGNVRHDARL